MSSEAQLRVGQVGLGYWGRNLARVFDDVADLTWLCDTSKALRTEFANRHPNAQITGDFEELLAADDVDAVVIATPVPTHYPLARASLEAGLHVFVEKPPAMRVAEMEELIALAEARGLVLMPGHLLLYHPAVQKMKELVDDGDLGEVLVVYGKYDLTFLPEFSEQVVHEFRKRAMDFTYRVLPCGHYTTGETPYKYMDGWHLCKFIRGAFQQV